MAPQENKPNSSLFVKAAALGSEFGFAIAIPLVGLGLLGKWLDSRSGTKYWVIVGILLALTSSSTWIGKRLMAIRKELRSNDKNDENLK